MNSLDPTLVSFAEHLRLANPFDDNRVTQIDSLEGDVPEIHSRAFEQLKQHAEKTSHQHKARGVVVSGSPGIGKSHLLARFGQWAREEKYPFVYLLNLQAGPADILRTILRATVSILTRDFQRKPHRSRLYKIICMAIKTAMTKYAPDQQLSISQGRGIYQRMLSDNHQTGDVYTVLWHLFEDVQRMELKKPRTNLAPLAIRWLSGDSLDHNEAARLGLSTPMNTDEGFSLTIEELKHVLRALCEFTMYRERSFILCFDQVDTLSEPQVQTWSGTIHALLDLCPGLLVVTSGVDETFLRWASRDLVSKASWDDRIRQFPLLLSGIDGPAAARLIEQRLQASLDKFSVLPEVQAARESDAFFPIGQSTVDAMLVDKDGSAKNDLRPRDIISRAGAAWDKQQRRILSEGLSNWLISWRGSMEDHASTASTEALSDFHSAKAVDSLLDRRIAEHLKRRHEHPEELPIDAGNLTGLLKSLLVMSLSASSDSTAGAAASTLFRVAEYESRGNVKSPCHFLLEYGEEHQQTHRRVGVTVADATSGIVATNMLKRIVAYLNETDSADEVVLVIDERSPWNLAAAGKDRLAELNAMSARFSVISLSFREYAELDALLCMKGLAQSGDLTITQTDGSITEVFEQDVRDSHHRTGRFLSSPLLKRLMEPSAVIRPGETIENVAR